MSKHPNHSYEAGPETLLMLAWCSTLDLRALLEKDHRERSWHYSHLDYRRDWEPVYPADILQAPITEALACLNDDLYGPALRSLVEYRLQLVDIDMAAHAIGLQGLAEPGHSLFYSDEPFEDYTVQQQRAKGPANETDALWRAISHHAAIHERLHDQSLTWKSGVCRGARALQAFFLSYPRLTRPCQNAPFFVRELLFMSLERVNWHAIAANVLLVEPPPCTCARSKQDDASVQTALFEELLKTVSHDLREASGRLPDPQRDTALFLSGCCEKASNVPPTSR